MVLHEKRVGGKTIADYIKERIIAGELRGKTFYSDLRDKFKESKDLGLFVIKNLEEPLPEALEKAISCVASDLRDAAGLREFLEFGAKPPNQKSAVVLCKTLRLFPAEGPRPQDDVWLWFAKYASRTDFHMAWHLEWGGMMSTVDLMLARSYLAFASENLPPGLWWNTNRGHASLILNAADMDRLASLPPDTPWTSVADVIARVVASSEVGSVIYASALRSISTERMSKTADEVIGDLMKQAVSLASMAEAKDIFVSKIKELGHDVHESLKPWPCSCVYRGVHTTVMACSALDWFTAKRAAAVVGAAVDCKTLEPLLCENGLVPGRFAQGGIVKVDDEAVADAKAARSTASSLVEARGIELGSEIVSLWKSKMKILTGIDREFRITMEFWNMHTGAAGEAVFRNSIVGCLPSEKQYKTFEVALTQLHSLRTSKLFQFCNVGLQQVLRGVISQVESLKGWRTPTVSTDGTPFVIAVSNGMLNFLRWPSPIMKTKARRCYTVPRPPRCSSTSRRRSWPRTRPTSCPRSCRTSRRTPSL